MELVDLFIIFLVLCLVAVIVAIVVSRRREGGKGISKDYALQVVMRRLKSGQPIGARFTREKDQWIWEFDILIGNQIQRFSVDARTSMILGNRDVTQANAARPDTAKMLGKRIG